MLGTLYLLFSCLYTRWQATTPLLITLNCHVTLSSPQTGGAFGLNPDKRSGVVVAQLMNSASDWCGVRFDSCLERRISSSVVASHVSKLPL